MVYSGDGLNGMSQAFHQLYRTRLAEGVLEGQGKAHPD